MANTPPFHIVIDSNHLKRDRCFSKPDLLYISALAKLGLIKLHIPWFIYKECTSSYTTEILLELENISNKLINLNRKGLHEKESLEAITISDSINDLKQTIATSVENVWKDFITETNAILYEYVSNESILVFENYFKGEKPFKSIKSRVDIPDAFIYLTLKKIAKTHLVHFITEDNNFRDKLSGEGYIRTLKNYEELFTSYTFQPIKKEYERIKEYEFYKEILLSKKEHIVEKILEYISSIDSYVIFDRKILSDNNQAIINSINNPIIDIHYNEIKFVGKYFFIPVVIKANALVDYFIFKETYRPEFYKKAKISDWSDQYFIAQELFKIIINKTIKVPSDDINHGLILDIQISEFDEVIIDED